MAHVTVDDNLVKEALEAGGHRTMKSAVTEALIEYVSRRKHQPDFSRYETVDYNREKSYQKLRDIGCKY